MDGDHYDTITQLAGPLGAFMVRSHEIPETIGKATGDDENRQIRIVIRQVGAYGWGGFIAELPKAVIASITQTDPLRHQSWAKATIVLLKAFSEQNNGKKAWQKPIR